MALRLNYLIVIASFLHSVVPWHLGYPHELPYSSMKVVKYGEPCPSPRYLPITIEEPVSLVEEPIQSACYQRLKLNYRLNPEPVTCSPVIRRKYPISVEVPEILSSPSETITCTPDFLRGKSYGYNVQLPAPRSVPTLTNYNFNLELPIPPSSMQTPEKTVKLLTGLTSRIDRVLVPACETPSCTCRTWKS